MDRLMIFVFNEDKKRYLTEYTTRGEVSDFLLKRKKDKRFYSVEWRRENVGKKKTECLSSFIYLRGKYVSKVLHSTTYEDIQNARKGLTVLFRHNGEIEYYPNSPLSTPEVKRIVGGWFTIKIHKEHPRRMAIVSQDPHEEGLKLAPIFNMNASAVFESDLYGNVLYINENYIA